MKVKDILPICPTYSDGSGEGLGKYNITIRYKNGKPGFYKHSLIFISNPYPFKSAEEILEEEIEEIGAGYWDDDRLQIYLKTDRFLQNKF